MDANARWVPNAASVGTIQLCIYGLLPVSGKNLAIPTGARADVTRGNVTVTWDPTPGATFYRVARIPALQALVRRYIAILEPYQDPPAAAK